MYGRSGDPISVAFVIKWENVPNLFVLLIPTLIFLTLTSCLEACKVSNLWRGLWWVILRPCYILPADCTILMLLIYSTAKSLWWWNQHFICCCRVLQTVYSWCKMSNTRCLSMFFWYMKPVQFGGRTATLAAWFWLKVNRNTNSNIPLSISMWIWSWIVNFSSLR